MYSSVVEMASNQTLFNRCVAAAAEQGELQPDGWVSNNIWHLAASPGWDDAWEYAKSTGNNAPGEHSGVIDDAMILAAVQARRDALAGA